MSAIQPSLIQSLYKDINQKDLVKDCIQTEAGKAVTRFIKANTTPQQFDAFCKNYPSYEPEHGEKETALGRAVIHDNISLAEHIIRKQVEERRKINLLNMGSLPLLWYPVVGKKKVGFDLLKLLINSGANVNLAYPSPFEKGRLETPLRTAAECGDLSMINMLIVNGGLIYMPFSVTGQHNVKKALDQLFNRVKPLFMLNLSQDNSIKNISSIIIQHEIWVEAHTYQEPQYQKPSLDGAINRNM